MGYKTKPGWLLPDVIDPPTSRCVQINVPDGDEYWWAFWAALGQLGWYNAWEKDELKRGKDAAAVWQNVIRQAREQAECMSVDNLNLQFEDCTLSLMDGAISLSSVAFNLETCDALQGPAGPAGDTGPAGPAGPEGESGEINDYAPPPEIGTDALCNAVDYVADKILDIITETITDAQTFTFVEVLQSFLFAGGWKESPLKQFLNLIYTNILEPNLIGRAGDIIADARQALYCASLDKAGFKYQMEESGITDIVARDAWIAAYDSVADGTVSLWVAVGREMTGADCSSYDCVPPILPCWDYRIDQYNSYGSGAVAPTYVQGVGWRQQNTTGAYAIDRLTQPSANGSHIWIKKLTTVIVTNFPITLRVNRTRNGYTSKRLIDNLQLDAGTHEVVWEGEELVKDIIFIILNGAFDAGQTVTVQSLCMELL